MTAEASLTTADRLKNIVGTTLDDGIDWTLSETSEGYRIALDDRILDLDERDGPAESTHWIITLRVDGETVSKFGPYESTDELGDQLETVLTSDVFYTVCCDG